MTKKAHQPRDDFDKLTTRTRFTGTQQGTRYLKSLCPQVQSPSPDGETLVSVLPKQERI
jgi:hypothetical protein